MPYPSCAIRIAIHLATTLTHTGNNSKNKTFKMPWVLMEFCNFATQSCKATKSDITPHCATCRQGLHSYARSLYTGLRLIHRYLIGTARNIPPPPHAWMWAILRATPSGRWPCEWPQSLSIPPTMHTWWIYAAVFSWHYPYFFSPE